MGGGAAAPPFYDH